MSTEEKIKYLIKLLLWIWLIEEKVKDLEKELFQKNENEIDEIIIKLEQYYQKQNILDKEFIKSLNKISNQIDESIESTIEKTKVENFNF